MATPNTVGFKQNQEPQKTTTKTNQNTFADNFIRNSKTILPSSALMAGLFSLFDARKNMKLLGPVLLHNLSNFVMMGVIVSGVDALFQKNPKAKQ